MKKFTEDKVKEIIKEKFGELYDTSKLVYKNFKTPFILICQEHGEFEITLKHINANKGCPMCKKKRQRWTKERLMEAFQKIHKNQDGTPKYIYPSDFDFHSIRDMINITCPIHGVFKQSISAHLHNGQGCPLCRSGVALTTDSFIERAKMIHQNDEIQPIYNKDKIKYVNYDTKICITCPIHGDYWQTPRLHLYEKCGCPKCANNERKTTDEFVSEAKEIHGNTVIYDEVKYINAHTKVKLICSKHGVFWQRPQDHLRGNSCPICKQSILERSVHMFLIKNNIIFQTQFSFEEIGRQTIDYYLPEYNICIECQGEQHFVPVSFTSKNDDECVDELEERIKRDIFKYEECKKKGIEVIYYYLPKLYSRNVNVNNISFYQDKNIFTSLKEMLNYIQNKINEKVND